MKDKLEFTKENWKSCKVRLCGISSFWAALVTGLHYKAEDKPEYLFCFLVLLKLWATVLTLTLKIFITLGGKKAEWFKNENLAVV